MIGKKKKIILQHDKMLVQKAYKFALILDDNQKPFFAQSIGHNRYIWNYFVKQGKWVGQGEADKEIQRLKKQDSTKWLKDIPSQTLQQTLKFLELSFNNFYLGKGGRPKTHDKYSKTGFRIPQHFQVDQKNALIKIPKVGWVKYLKTRGLEGKPKNITITREAGQYFVSIQCEMITKRPVINETLALGIDVGVNIPISTSEDINTATNNNNLNLPELNKAKIIKLNDKKKKLQQYLAKKKKSSKRKHKLQLKIAKIHRDIANIRKEFIRQATTRIVNKYKLVVSEDLNIKNMTANTSGTVENPGVNVQQKSDLNREILNIGWGIINTILKYKLEHSGGRLLKVNPSYTSQKCSCCGFTDKGNRLTQDKFKCINCDFECNADINAANNIIKLGLDTLSKDENVVIKKHDHERLVCYNIQPVGSLTTEVL